MADSDKTLKLAVTLDGYVMPGAEDVAKQMGVITVTATDVDAILKKGGETIEETAAKTGHLTSNQRALHTALHLVGREAGPAAALGIGALADAVTHGAVGTMTLIGAIEVLKSVLESIKAVDALNIAAFEGDKAAVDAVKEAYERAAIAARMFAEEEARRHLAGPSVEDSAGKSVQNLKTLHSAQMDYMKAAKALDDEYISKQAAAGIISKEKENKEKFALDVEYARQKLMLDSQLRAQELAAKKEVLSDQTDQLQRAQADQKKDLDAAATADAKKAQHEKREETAKKNLESAQKSLEELGKSHGSIISGEFNDETAGKLEEYYQKYIGDSAGKSHSEMFKAFDTMSPANIARMNLDPSFANFMLHTTGQQEGEVGFAKYDLAKSQEAGSKKELAALEKSQFDVNLAAERSKKQLDSTDDAVRKLQESVDKLTREIPNAKADNAAAGNNAGLTTNLDLRAQALKLGLPDPGNIFASTAKPVASTSEVDVTNSSPWRAPENSGNDFTPKMVGEIAHSKQGLVGAAQAIHAAHMDHNRAVLLAFETVAKQMGLGSQQILQLERQIANQRNNNGN